MTRYNDKTELNIAAVRDLANSIARLQADVIKVADEMEKQQLPVIHTTNVKTGYYALGDLSKLVYSISDAFVMGIGQRNLAKTGGEYKSTKPSVSKVAEPFPTKPPRKPSIKEQADALIPDGVAAIREAEKRLKKSPKPPESSARKKTS